jgi:hypothetical protein
MRGPKKTACFPRSGQSWRALITMLNVLTGQLSVGSAGMLIGVVYSDWQKNGARVPSLAIYCAVAPRTLFLSSWQPTPM